MVFVGQSDMEPAVREPIKGGPISFGPFSLDAAGKQLTVNGTPVRIGKKALDILIILATRAGEVVSNVELQSLIWPNSFVEEAPLRVHINALRKALDSGPQTDRYIVNVTGRGYCFVAHTTRSPELDSPSSLEHAPDLPLQTLHLVGRDEAIYQVAGQLLAHRFVTIVGLGGIGKSTVGLAVGHRLKATFHNAVWLMDLGSVSDPSFVAASLANLFGLTVRTNDPITGILAYLKERRLMLIFDGCEHVIDAVAALARQIISQTRQVHILVTSRETLRVKDEHVYLLPLLASPPSASLLNADEAMTYSAVRLFVQSVANALPGFALTETDVPIASDICRRLDGIALGIKLAAGQVEAHGVAGVAKLIKNFTSIQSLKSDEASPPRHRTLWATLEWSYNLSQVGERKTLRHLAVFPGEFDLEDACSIVAAGQSDRTQTVTHVAVLAARSLVSVTIRNGGNFGYRLLDTTREYLVSKLYEHRENTAARRRHAAYCLRLIETAVGQPSVTADAEARTRRSGLIANILAALEWSFSANGDDFLGVTLAEAGAPIFSGASLLEECVRWCELALVRLAPALSGTQLEMRLSAWLGTARLHTRGFQLETKTALSRALKLSIDFDDYDHRIKMLAGMAIFYLNTGALQNSQEAALQLLDVAREGNTDDMALGHSMLAAAQHLSGKPKQARENAAKALTRSKTSSWRGAVNLGFDHAIIDHCIIARSSALEGNMSEAIKLASMALIFAEQADDPVGLSSAIIWVFGCFEDFSRSTSLVDQLLKVTEENGLLPFHSVGLCLRGSAAHFQGIPLDVDSMRSAIDILDKRHLFVLSTTMKTILSSCLAMAGRGEEALRVIDDVLHHHDTLDLPPDYGLALVTKGNILRHCLGAPPAECAPFFKRASALALERDEKINRMEVAYFYVQSFESISLDELRDILGPICAEFPEEMDLNSLRLCRSLLNGEKLAKPYS